MKTRTRPVKRPQDDDFLREVYRATRLEEMAQSGWPDEQIRTFLDQQFHFQDVYYQREFPKAAYSIVELDGTPIGRLYLDRRKDEHRIIDIALLTEYRGKGIGGMLMRGILAEAKKAGKPVGIHVEQNNPAMSLYKRLGFEKTGEAGLYHLMTWRPSATRSE